MGSRLDVPPGHFSLKLTAARVFLAMVGGGCKHRFDAREKDILTGRFNCGFAPRGLKVFSLNIVYKPRK